MGIEHVQLRAGELVLRPPRAEEAAEALAMLEDPDVRLWNPAPAVHDLASAGEWCAGGADWTTGTHATFSIVTVDDAFVGNVSLYAIDGEQRTANIGYRVARRQRGRGAATDAVGAVTAWAFRDLGLERIQLFHAIENTASCRVAAKTGYELEGHLRAATVCGDGRRHDEHLHARLS